LEQVSKYPNDGHHQQGPVYRESELFGELQRTAAQDPSRNENQLKNSKRSQRNGH
jgi:hypothetical protein